MVKPIRFEATVHLPCTPEQLWPYIADTDRMDRAVGLPPATFSRTERPEGGETVIGEYRRLGRVLARWIEYPFEWERPYRYSIQRDYETGPLSRFIGGATLEPVGTGTIVHLVSEMTPRSRLTGPLVHLAVGQPTLHRAIAQYRTIAAYVAGTIARPFPQHVAEPGSIDEARLERLLARLRATGAAEACVGRLAQLLRTAPDEEVVGLRPLELADRWQIDRSATLDCFLHAATVGLLELHWELLCPGCRGVKAMGRHLREVALDGTCPACHQHFVVDTDELIEARFYPTPAIRQTQVQCYCVGSPMTTPHRLAQITLAPGEQRAWRLTFPAGHYRLRSPQCPGLIELRAEVVGAEQATLYLLGSAMTLSQARLQAGAVTLTLMNQAPHRVTVTLDDAHWPQTGATPARLMTAPAFHSLFSAEALAGAARLAISRVSLVFTDLAGSTALYEQIGQARAYRLVTEHFELLQEAIAGQGGAVVKTIGDAVMAAFPDGSSALTGALAMQRALQRLEAPPELSVEQMLKVGIHVGPTYLVTANERLDYFGTTVNLAARAQQAAHGGEIVVTRAVLDESRAEIDAAGLRIQPDHVLFKGLAEPIEIYRLTGQPSGDQPHPGPGESERMPACPAPHQLTNS